MRLVEEKMLFLKGEKNGNVGLYREEKKEREKGADLQERGKCLNKGVANERER